ncbi:hypothetical protein HOD08_05390 [bacterium]|nr:hypothetical protein [bacterium]
MRTILYFPVVAMVFLAGCSPFKEDKDGKTKIQKMRTVELLAFEIPQAKKVFKYEDLAKKNLKSTRLYDDFSTVASFDAIYLGDEMREALTDMKVSRRGWSEAKKQLLLKGHEDESAKWHVFYVMSEVREREFQSLADDLSSWALSLSVDDNDRVPSSFLKEIEPDPEIRTLFGTSYTRHKIAYLVKFEKKPNDNVEKLKLCFRSPKHAGDLDWVLDDTSMLRDAFEAKEAESVDQEVLEEPVEYKFANKRTDDISILFEPRQEEKKIEDGHPGEVVEMSREQLKQLNEQVTA